MAPRQAFADEAPARRLVVRADHLAVLHAGDALSGGGHVVVVGDHQDRLAACVQATEQLDDLLAAFGVEGAGGLVGEQEGGLVGERPGDGEALALATGQRARRRLRLVRQAEQVEQVSATRLRRLALQPGHHGGERHVLQDGHALEQVEELEDDPDVLAAHPGQLVLGLAGDLLVGEHDRALVGLVEAGDEVEQGRLAAARRAHDRDELAPVHLEVGTSQRAHGSVLRLEGAPHAPHVQHQLAHRFSSITSAVCTHFTSSPLVVGRLGAGVSAGVPAPLRAPTPLTRPPRRATP